MQGRDPELVLRHEGQHPLLVMKTESDLAGFSVMNGNPHEAFRSAYQAFRNLYRDEHLAWSERNLSFVICRSRHRQSDDAFFSQLEVDPYFCRKYVVDLPADTEELEQELLRLPFLPLKTLSTESAGRPPSAQSLLQDNGVSATLARYLIVPRARSPKGIVEETDSQPELLGQVRERARSELRQAFEHEEPIRIRSIEIEAFRAFRKKQKFDLNTDIIVLYGPNGLGKTSFFDAIDYASTGRIGRLDRVDHEHFVNIARHLDAPQGAGSVTMEVEHASSNFAVHRTVEDWSYASVGDGTLNRTAVLERLTRAKWGDNKERVENLEHLFRATHLFSQSDPELLTNFKSSGTLSQGLVTRMLALEDYSTGSSKVEQVLSLLRTQITRKKNRLTELDKELKSSKGQLKQLPSLKETVKAGNQFKKLASELLAELKGEVGLDAENEEVTSESVRDWRALIDAELKNAREDFERARNLQSGFSQYGKNIDAVGEKLSKLEGLNEIVRKQKSNQKRLLKAEKVLSTRIDKSKAEISEAQARQQAYRELVELQSKFLSAQASLHTWKKELKRLDGEASTSSANLLELVPKAEELTAKKDDGQLNIDVKSQLAQALGEIRNGLEASNTAKKEEVKLRKSIASGQSQIQALQVSIDEQQREIDAKATELKEREEEYEKLTENQADLTRLLDEIEAHVSDATCPTCATDHGTKANLIKRIRAQKQSRPKQTEEVASSCRELSEFLEEARISKRTIVQKRASQLEGLKEAEIGLDVNQKVLSSFESSLIEVGLDAGDQDLATTIDERLSEANASLHALEVELVKTETAKDSTDRRIQALRSKLLRNTEAQNQAKASLAPLEQEIRDLQTKASTLELSVDLDPSEVAKEIETWTGREIEAKKRKSDLTGERESLDEKLETVKATIDETNEDVEIVTEDKKALEIDIASYKDAVADVAQGDEFGLDNIIEKRSQLAERVEVLERLIRRAITLERSLDSKQRTAIIAELEADADALNAEKKQLNEDLGRMSENAKRFSQISDLLSEQNSAAIENYVHAHGPLTSLIQKRLRSVYGFSDISLRTKGNAIQVLVNWRDREEEVKPTEYFSDSQNQILMLSLFLAGTLTQTWSAFSPILLDDPVTHFDDINTYGFVELIRGLVNTSPGKRQFIISVCEESLYDVMRKKFRNVEGGCRFYRFEGIGSDGPVVSQIEN